MVVADRTRVPGLWGMAKFGSRGRANEDGVEDEDEDEDDGGGGNEGEGAVGGGLSKRTTIVRARFS